MAVVQTWTEDEVDYETETGAADSEQVGDGEDLADDAQSESDTATSEEAEEDQEPEEEAESPVAQEVQQAEPVDQDRDFRIEIWNAEMRCRGKEAVVEDLKEQLKWAKQDYEASVTALRKLANEAHHPMPLFDSQPKQSEGADQEVAASEPETIESEAVDESWRDRSFIEFIESKEIEGLGKKKLEALGDLISTFGDFQDLRTKASLEHVPLCKLLPSGFGEKVTTQIENAFLDVQWNDSRVANPRIDDDGPELVDNEEIADELAEVDLENL